MQQREVVEGWLWNAALGKNAKPAVERSLDDALFLEHVGKGPIAHHFRQAVAFANGVGQKRSHVGTVGNLGLIAVVGVVLGPDEWDMRIGGGGDLLMHFAYGAADHCIARDAFVGTEDVFRFVI